MSTLNRFVTLPLNGIICQFIYHIVFHRSRNVSIADATQDVPGSVQFNNPGSFVVTFEKYSRLKRNFRDHHFWARGYYVSTVGLDEGKIRKYIQDQETNESIENKYDSDLSNPF